jgi:hypothetical protein
MQTMPMNAPRCVALMLLCLASPLVLATVTPDPAPKVEQADAQSASHSAAAKTDATKTGVTKTGVAKKTPAKSAVRASKSKKPTKATAASKSKQRKESDVVAAPLPEVKLDLSLPHEMVKDLHAPGKVAAVKPRDGVLPPLFPDKRSEDAFQLNGRLLSNEMQLQLRDDRRSVEGAALDFEFKQ